MRWRGKSKGLGEPEGKQTFIKVLLSTKIFRRCEITAVNSKL